MRHRAIHGLDAHAGEPAQLPDQFVDFGAALAGIEEKWAGLLDRVLVATFGLAVTAQHI